jgi:hypothetical protein
MIWPGEMFDLAANLVVAVARPFGAKLEDAPARTMAGGYELEQFWEGVAIGKRGVGDGGAGGYD